MRRVLGVDLASARWRDTGTAVLAFEPGRWLSAEVAVLEWPETGRPTPDALAGAIDGYARATGIEAVSIDGPQGWRDPAATGWGRRADREARTPGKPGPPGSCVPGTYLAWTTFSIEVFDRLAGLPHVLLVNGAGEAPPPRPGGYLLLESFPTSTWRTAGLSPLPGKGKRPDARAFAHELETAFSLPALGRPSHDDLQAVVAALPAAALLGAPATAVARGEPGRRVDGYWVEGLIWDAAPAVHADASEPQPPRPLLLVVSGPPASGKTSIAEELAERLKLAVVSKDTFKERLYEVFGSNDELEPKIEQAGLAILFSVVAMQLDAGVSVLAESNFDANSDLEPLRRLVSEHHCRLVQIHCRRPQDELLERFVERVEEGRRHPGHGDEPEDVEEVRAKLEAGVWDPLDLPGELIEADKGSPAFSYDELARRVRDAEGR